MSYDRPTRRRRSMPSIASIPEFWMEAVAWPDDACLRTKGSWRSTCGGSPNRTPTRASTLDAPHPRHNRALLVAAAASTFLRKKQRERTAMNKYARIAQEHWQRHAPSRYAALEDPESYFQDLGETALTQIAQMEAYLERQLPTDLPYLDRVRHLQSIRLRAEETVLTDLVYSVESEPTTLSAELEEILGELPPLSTVLDSIDRIRQEAEDATEQDGFSTVSMTADQQDRITRLEGLLVLLKNVGDPDRMSESELGDTIRALRPYLRTPLAP